MNVLTFDFETTTYNAGNPFDERNSAVCMAYKWNYEDVAYCIDLTNEIGILEAQQQFEQADWLVGFNLPFDLHWVRNIGVDVRNYSVLDAQVAEFLLSNQTQAFPSLNQCAEKYLQEKKHDEVAFYWEKGIDTKNIPKDILHEYAKQDVLLTEKIAKKQQKLLMEQGKWNLFRLQMEDLLVLQDMTYNGIRFDTDEAKRLAKETIETIKDIDNELFSSHIYGDYINPASGDHVSCFLYGGRLTHEDRVPNGIWKSGAKAGTTRYKTVVYELTFPRIFEPIPGSELKKEGFYATDEKTLRKLKGSKDKKKLIELLLKRSELEKLVGTYYEGIPKIIEQYHWKKDHVHGQLNMCVARTGRLSSSKPNQQNFAGTVKSLLYTRYK